MIKELFLAIILGALLGFGITGGFFAVNKSRNSSSATSQNTSQLTPTETATQNNTTVSTNNTESASENSLDENQLVIDTPENESLVSNSKITIKGTTTPESIVIIITPIKSYNVKADGSGNFTAMVDLESGANLIRISSIDNSDNQVESQLLVTYSTAKI